MMKITMTKHMDKVAMNGNGMMKMIKDSVFRLILLVILPLIFGLAFLPVVSHSVPIDEQEYFDTADVNNDYSFWINDAGSPGTNGFLMTRQTSTGTNSCTGGAGISYTPSANTGPCSIDTGTGFLFLENSGAPPFPDRTFTRIASFDADANVLNISFSYNLNTITPSENPALRLEANHNGGGWTTEWQQVGPDGNGGSWTPVSINLSNGEGLSSTQYNNGTVDLRFVFVSGTTWANDVGLDSVRVFGPDACTPTNGPVTITGGSANGNPVDVCSTFTTNGASLTNVTIDNGGPDLYNGPACSGIDATGWPASATLNISASADNSCGQSVSDSGTFDYTSCVPTTGPLEVQDGGILSGTTTDVLSIINQNGVPAGNISNVKVYEVAGAGGDIDDLEKFEEGGISGWSPNWVATIADGSTPQIDPPGNGDLQTGTFTRSANTGPSSTPNGAFLFYESSVGAGTDRYMVSQNTYDAGNNQLSVEFEYNMNGADIGTLELQVQNPNYNAGAWTTEWTLSGNQNDVWSSASVDLYGGAGASATAYVTGNTNIRFRFVYGGGPLGDIAINEVRVLGPRGTGALWFDGTGTEAQTAKTDGTGGFPAWAEGTIRVDVTGTDDCGGGLADIGFGSFVADLVAPTVDSFSLPAASLNPISVYSFSASDNLGVAGYLVTETPAQPSAGAAGWTATPPLNITTASLGPVTFYAWAKDLAGNVSSAPTLQQTVTVSPDTTPPTVTAFTMPASSFSPITVQSLSASDDSGTVAAYMVTESATQPGAGDAGWMANPPASITTASTGNTNFYAWAKDASDNVSTSLMVTVDVKVDSNPPVVTFVLPATHDALEVPITTFTAADNVPDVQSNTGVTGYMITTSATPPLATDPGWMGSPPTTVTVPDENPNTFWAWAKDAVGNVSSAVSDSVTVTLPASCDFDVSSPAPGGAVYVDAENFTNVTAANPWVMNVVTSPPLADNSGDTSDGGYLSTTTGGTGTTPNGSRHDYPVTITTTGTYCIWIRALDQAGAGGGDSTFWGVDGNYVGAMTQTADNEWAWTNGTQNGSGCTTITAGQHTINLWPREAGQKTDAFILTTNASANAGGLFSGNNDQNTTKANLEAANVKVVDPTCTTTPGGGGGGDSFITIPDGQSVNGTTIDVETLYTTDFTNPLQYRALGGETDGFEATGIDPKWFHTNVGNDALLASTTGAPLNMGPQGHLQGGGEFQLAGSGQDIWNNNDFFQYHYQPGVSGDFTIDVKITGLVDSQTGTTANENVWAKAGIMVRQSLSSNSRHAMIVATPGNGIRMQYRPTDGATSQNPSANQGGAAGANTWLRLVRQGNIFTGYFSTNNGQTWTLSASGNVSMTDPVNIGLAVTSHNTGRDSIATFDNFMFMPAGTSGMTTSWASTGTALDTTQTTAWTDGTYGLAVRDSAAPTVYQANVFDFSSCTDASPSTITVAGGSTVGGSAVSLNNLFSSTGNVGSFSYQIDGVDVSNPWNSYAKVPNGSTGTINLTISGVDPDCGGSTVSNTAVINIDNQCSDPDPSTITILTGQVTGGSSVDLTQMFTYTGDVATNGFVYKINGAVVGDPTNWDSRQYGTQDAEAVSLEVSGIDPDCGNGITAINDIVIDNTCVRNPPSINFSQDVGYVGAGRAIPYIVTIRNEDSYNCGPSTFDVTVLSDSNGTDFVPSYFNPVGSNLNITLDGREHFDFELAVEAAPGATEWNTNDTTLEITSDFGAAHNNADWVKPLDTIPDGKVTGSITTKVFLVSPITHNSVTTNSPKWGGSVDADGNTVNQGSWGTSEPGSKYGNFDCETCHSKTGSEIKWMMGNIATEDSSNWGVSGQPSLPIQFKDARSVDEIVAEGGDPINDVYWGHDDPNDDGSGRATSDRVCEICHSITEHHRYDTNTNPPDPPEGAVGPMTINPFATHFPGRDCTDCHRHSLGFTADCTGCHGDPPLEATIGGPNGLADIPGVTGSVTPGTHYKHTVVLDYPCEYCHAGWRTPGEMPKEIGGLQDINHLFNVFTEEGMTDPVRNNGSYTGQDGVSYEGVVIAPGAGTMTCENIYCHGGTESMGGTNPQWNGNITCNACHGTSATNTPPGYSHTTHVGQMGLDCTVCHFTGGKEAGFNGHVNGRVNLEMNTPAWQALTPMYDPDGSANLDGGANRPAVVAWDSNPDGDDMPPSTQYGTCLNVYCHYGNETPPWNNNNQPATCVTCHNDGAPDNTNVDTQLQTSAPNTGWHEEHVHPTTGISTLMIDTFVNKCESCHGGGSNTGSHPGHVNFQVDLGGGLTFSESSQTCTSQCHDLGGIDTKGTQTPSDDTEVDVTWVRVANYTLRCDSCHKAPYLGPTVVDPDNEGTGLNTADYGSHLRTFSGQTLNQSTSWTQQCRFCHPYHADEGLSSYAEIPQPDPSWDQLGDGTDMAYKLGLQFPVTGGIHMGGSGTTGNTEAQMCWNCHDGEGFSEWGTNNKAMTGNMTYNYGSLNSSNWTTAIWTSGTAQFGYKTAAIQSTHAASTADGAASGVDPVNAIRCSYCHDVHDRNKALIDHNAGTYETLTGAPYLRGTWMGNPYKEDGAPQSGTNYTNFGTDRFGQVPRGSTEQNQLMGGYWIDQNSGDPVSAFTYDQFGGICQLCHGTDVNTLNQYGSNGAGWVSGYNGHANSVKGGAGGGSGAEATARNIFNGRGGGTNGYNGYMGYWGYREPGDGGGGIRGGDGDSWNITPGVDGYGNEPCANDNGSCNGNYGNGHHWEDMRPLNMTGTTTDSNYHTFSCAKCHNPHASRLPKLMITNCLDTKQNQWDNNIQAGTAGPAVLDNVSASSWTTAQNCHRLVANDPMDGNDQNQNAQGAGWNMVTPWTDGDANYGTTGDKTQDNSGTW